MVNTRKSSKAITGNQRNWIETLSSHKKSNQLGNPEYLHILACGLPVAIINYFIN